MINRNERIYSNIHFEDENDLWLCVLSSVRPPHLRVCLCRSSIEAKSFCCLSKPCMTQGQQKSSSNSIWNIILMQKVTFAQALISPAPLINVLLGSTSLFFFSHIITLLVLLSVARWKRCHTLLHVYNYNGFCRLQNVEVSNRVSWASQYYEFEKCQRAYYKSGKLDTLRREVQVRVCLHGDQESTHMQLHQCVDGSQESFN